jgi:hypothetical protein
MILLPSTPLDGKHLRLLLNSLSRLFLLVRRIAVLTQNALDDEAKVRPHVVPNRPIDSQVLPHGCDEFSNNRAQSFKACDNSLTAWCKVNQLESKCTRNG